MVYTAECTPAGLCYAVHQGPVAPVATGGAIFVALATFDVTVIGKTWTGSAWV